MGAILTMFFGTVLIALSLLAGTALGSILGSLFNLDTEVGSVGFGILIFLFLISVLKSTRHFSPDLEKGILFWKQLYIPIVIAMASTQDVFSAMSKGGIAIACGAAPVLLTIAIMFLLRERLESHEADS